MSDLYLKAYDDVTLALVGRLPIIVVPALGDIVNVVITLLEPDKLPPNMNNNSCPLFIELVAGRVYVNEDIDAVGSVYIVVILPEIVNAVPVVIMWLDVLANELFNVIAPFIVVVPCKVVEPLAIKIP